MPGHDGLEAVGKSLAAARQDLEDNRTQQAELVEKARELERLIGVKEQEWLFLAEQVFGRKLAG